MAGAGTKEVRDISVPWSPAGRKSAGEVAASLARLAGRRAAVVGLGVSNLALIDFLRGLDLDPPVCLAGFDKKPRAELAATADRLEAMGIPLFLGGDYLDGLAGHDLVFLTPGMPKDLPAVARARADGAEVSSEMKLFFELCRGWLVGVTGSAGKTTTTTLIGRILEAAFGSWAEGEGHVRPDAGPGPVLVGGNIGRPLIGEVLRIPPTAWVVLELSSFQLELLDQSPNLAVFLNLSPNHLDLHGSMEAYVAAKTRIFRYQKPGDVALLNAGSPRVAGLAEEVPGRLAWFGRENPRRPGGWVADGRLVVDVGQGPETVMEVGDIQVPGAHNVENALAAAVAARLCGVEADTIGRVIAAFGGVEHRLELVRTLDGVRYYNDSIATAPDRTLAALAAVPGSLVLVAGGYDKGIPFDELGEAVAGRVKCLVLLGKTAPKIEAAVRAAVERGGAGAGPRILRASSFDEAVELARGAAEPGDAVLLSPACASYDMFRNFEERGRRFKAIVRGWS